MPFLDGHYLRIASTPTNMVFEECMSNFEQMFTLAAAVINSLGTAETSLLSFDMGAIPSLYVVALKCSFFHLRKPAIELLGQAPKQEGLWGRDFAVEHATWKLDIKERGISPVSGRAAA